MMTDDDVTDEEWRANLDSIRALGAQMRNDFEEAQRALLETPLCQALVAKSSGPEHEPIWVLGVAKKLYRLLPSILRARGPA